MPGLILLFFFYFAQMFPKKVTHFYYSELNYGEFKYSEFLELNKM